MLFLSLSLWNLQKGSDSIELERILHLKNSSKYLYKARKKIKILA